MDARHDRPSIQKRRVGHGIESMDAADCRHSSLTDAVGGGVGPCVRRRNSWRRFSAADLARRRVSPICMRGVVKITSSAVTNGERERQRGGGSVATPAAERLLFPRRLGLGLKRATKKNQLKVNRLSRRRRRRYPPTPSPRRLSRGVDDSRNGSGRTSGAFISVKVDGHWSIDSSARGTCGSGRRRRRRDGPERCPRPCR